jgi:SH3 domain protein
MKRILHGNYLGRAAILTFIVSGLLCPAAAVYAERGYVTDSFKITVRTGPSIENKIIAMLSTGDPVEILEEQKDWSLVRLVDSPDQKEGWVLNRYLMYRKPWRIQSEDLAQQNEQLKERVTALQEGKVDANSLQTELEQTKQKLEKARLDFENLKLESANYLQLKEEYQGLQAALENARQEAQKLSEETESMRLTQNVKWFLAGGLVFLVGWLIGLSMGRLQKRRRRTTYEF